MFVFDLSINAQEKLYVYAENSKFGLKSEKEKILTEPIFEKIGWSNGSTNNDQSTIGYFNSGWGLVSSKGKIITPPEFSNLIPAYENQFIASKANHINGTVKFGLIDNKGKELLPFVYDSLRTFHHDLYVFKDSTQMMGIIDESGNLYYQIKFDQLNLLSKDLYYIIQSGKLGVIDTLGKLKLKPEFKSINENLTTTAFGQIEIRTNQNNLLHSFEADSIIILSNDYIAVFCNRFLTIYDDFMHPFIKQADVSRLAELDENIALYTDDGALLFSKIKRQTPHIFENLEPGEFGINSTKLIATKQNGLWGYVNTIGEVVIPFKYKKASAFIGDIAIVNTERKRFLINTTGRRIGFTDYDAILIQSNNTAIGKVNDRSELLDFSGAILFEVYGDIIPHSLGYLTVNQFGDIGLINEYGETILNPIHQKISDVINGKYLVVKTPSRLGLTLLDGTWFYWLTGDFQDMKAVTEDYIGIQRNNQWGYINYKKQLLIANRYDNIRCFYNNMAAVNLNGGWGFIDEREKLIVQPTFNEISDFESRCAIVNRNDKYGIINSFGQLTTKIEYDSLVRLPNQTDKFITIKDNNYGLINSKGKQIIPTSYSFISPISGNYYLVGRRNLIGLINNVGEFSIPLKYIKITEAYNEKFICYLPVEDSI